MFYLAKTPNWLKKLFPGRIWEMPLTKKAIYLSFDDGPHPQITPFVLDELGKYDAKATFFCIGKNVKENREVYNRIIKEGHAVGNHTYSHPDGWKTNNVKYLQNILDARKFIDSRLFRPPYGRITRRQQKKLSMLKEPFNVVMWTVLSGDFDINISGRQCYNNVVNNTKSGSVIVFHDSEKAFERMQFTLPRILQYFSEKGYQFEKIEI